MLLKINNEICKEISSCPYTTETAALSQISTTFNTALTKKQIQMKRLKHNIYLKTQKIFKKRLIKHNIY